MEIALHKLRILGVHPVVPSTAELDHALGVHWGSGLKGDELGRARAGVRDHFGGLFLIEIQFEPANASIDWSQIVQPSSGLDRSSWQVPYDERPVDRSAGRWAFFLHYVDLTRTISTPAGERYLPPPTPTPPHLEWIKYELPG